MEDGDEFILYLPDTPIDGLDEWIFELVAGSLCVGGSRNAGNVRAI